MTSVYGNVWSFDLHFVDVFLSRLYPFGNSLFLYMAILWFILAPSSPLWKHSALRPCLMYSFVFIWFDLNCLFFCKWPVQMTNVRVWATIETLTLFSFLSSCYAYLIPNKASLTTSVCCYWSKSSVMMKRLCHVSCGMTCMTWSVML